MTGDWQDEAMYQAMLYDAAHEVDAWLLPLAGDDIEMESSDGHEDDGDLAIDLWSAIGREINEWLCHHPHQRKECEPCPLSE